MTNPIERLKDSRKNKPRLVGTSTGTMGKGNKRKSNKGAKRPPYIPDDETIGGPDDRWMQPGPYPIGQGHTAIVRILGDGSHQKCFKQKWLDAYTWMLPREIKGLQAMGGVHAPHYISNDAISVTMTDAGVHLTAANMPDDWDSQIGTILQTLEKAKIRHNDIIPRNIMLKDGQITLIDFSMSTIIGQPYHTPWPNKRLLKIVQRDADRVMLRRAINFILGRQEQWKEVNRAMATIGTILMPGSTTHKGMMYHDVPFNIIQVTHRKHTGSRASAIKAVYDLNNKTGLDLGCSVGGMLFWLNGLGATMIGVERDPQAMRVARALRGYYAIKNVTFHNEKINNALKRATKCDFVCYLSTFMWVLKEEGLEGAKASLEKIGLITDTLFFETSHGDAMAGGAVKAAGLDNKDKMDRLVMDCTGLTKMKELFIDKGWNNRRLVMFTR